VDSTEVKTVPTNVAYCRGTKCDKLTTCSHEGSCQYKSSAELLKEDREARAKVLVENIDSELEQLDMFPENKPVVRTFETGANRDVDDNKLDYEGFLSPLVLRRFAEYMHKNRKLRDGSVRASDNWQKGMPRDVYMKSMWRHFMAVWEGHRAGTVSEEDLCGVIFNVQGMLHEVLKVKK